MIAFAILGMCDWLARWYDPRKSISVDELIETYFDMLAYGLVREAGVQRRVKSLLAGKRAKPSTRGRAPEPVALLPPRAGASRR